MARVVRPYAITAEVVERTPGVWCPRCECPTGVRVVFAYHHGDGTTRISPPLARCTECKDRL